MTNEEVLAEIELLGDLREQVLCMAQGILTDRVRARAGEFVRFLDMAVAGLTDED